jgi:hypothetical protein
MLKTRRIEQLSEPGSCPADKLRETSHIWSMTVITALFIPRSSQCLIKVREGEANYFGVVRDHCGYELVVGAASHVRNKVHAIQPSHPLRWLPLTIHLKLNGFVAKGKHART